MTPGWSSSPRPRWSSFSSTRISCSSVHSKSSATFGAVRRGGGVATGLAVLAGIGVVEACCFEVSGDVSFLEVAAAAAAVAGVAAVVVVSSAISDVVASVFIVVSSTFTGRENEIRPRFSPPPSFVT